MRFLRLFAVTVLFAAAPLWADAHAATAISKEEANAFYGQCMRTPDPRLSQEAQGEYCACTSAFLMQTMSAEDWKLAQQETGEGRVMRNKMLIAVHGPCLGTPVAELQYNTCGDDPRVALADKQVNQGILCGCMSQKIGEWLTEAGADVMAQTVAYNPFVTDPLEPVMESEIYKREKYEIMLDCFGVAMGHRQGG